MNRHPAYWNSTRHPWPCLLFVLPLLVAYEAGVLWLGGVAPMALRNGADAWLRWSLEAYGLRQAAAAPVVVLLILGVWSWRRREDRPEGLFNILLGMALESLLFALGLWGLSHAFAPLLDYTGVALAAPTGLEAAVGRVVTFVGAGVYEEVLFRLILFSALAALLKLATLPSWAAFGLAALASALLFAAAHHAGPYGEKFNNFLFLFRALAGLYFVAVFRWRGFGVAAGAHACYDVLVGAGF
jgi:membrane protease YdiL (CAAX protease family)